MHVLFNTGADQWLDYVHSLPMKWNTITAIYEAYKFIPLRFGSQRYVVSNLLICSDVVCGWPGWHPPRAPAGLRHLEKREKWCQIRWLLLSRFQKQTERNFRKSGPV